MPRGTESSFWDHLDQARAGILRALVYLAVGTSVAWIYREPIFYVLRWPAEEGARWAHVAGYTFRIFEPAGGLILMMQSALVAGALLALPLVLWEVYRFVSPALEPRERRAALLLIPGAVGLFLAGAAFCYFVSPIFFAFLIAFNQSLGVIPEVALVPYLRFFLQLVLVVGLSFELPLVLMFLVYFGITSSRALTERWRGSVVIILVVVAIITPTTDPLSMTIVAVPLILLYFLSIWLAKLVEKRRADGEPTQPTPPTDDDPYGLGGSAKTGLAAPGVADELSRQADGGFVNEKLLDDDVADDGEPPPGPGG